MLRLFKKVRWAVFDCLKGTVVPVEKFPFELGSGEGVDLKFTGQGVRERHCAINNVKGHGLCLAQLCEGASMLINGQPGEFSRLQPDTDYSLKIGPNLLAIRGDRDIETWQQSLDPAQWLLFSANSETPEGPMPLHDLCRMARERGWHPFGVVIPKGIGMGFYLYQAFDAVDSSMAQPAQWPAQPAASPGPDEVLPAPYILPILPTDRGSLTCPVCWLKLDEGDIMHVAVHDSLRGDPVLGEDAQQRFHATRFNDRGQALDALGLPCTETACPHCRRVLPPGFVEVKHHILSLVGDQSAGKSYYLSVLINELAVSLYRHFSAVFQDADPTGNAMLNEMKKTLFGAQTPEDARLVKTQLEGAMYERLPRYGRMVALPKPFIYSISSLADQNPCCAVIFYDNAGEHFQPGRDSADSPGSQHVASSSGNLFLFDPFNHPAFRKRIAECLDPQIEKPVLAQQDIILSEMKVRIKKLLGLGAEEKVRTPLALLVGKCDTWMSILGDNPFRNPIRNGRLVIEDVRHNSQIVRNMMLEIAPTIVAIAEEMSQTILYFPVSSFGHSPAKIGPGNYVPDPRRLKPILVEIPVLWMLSMIRPDLVPADQPYNDGQD